MKRFKNLISVLIINFIFSVSIFSQEYLIASFNTLRLGQNKKDYKKVAEILNNFPIIGLIEVMNREGVEKLVDSLEEFSGEKWSYFLSPYSVGTDGYKEYYAYIWKSDSVSFIKENGFFHDSFSSFIRPPFGATFKIDNFDFTLVLAHFIYGKKKSFREAEAFYLNDVYNYFQNLDSIENDVIIAGDFNLPANNNSFLPLVLKNKDNIIYALSPSLLTTIGKKNLANSYDNIFLSLKYTKEFTGVSGTYNFTYHGFEYSRRYISDHLPVFIEISSENEDDD